MPCFTNSDKIRINSTPEENMSNQLFKKSKIEERFSSPEQLNGYVRVTNPGVWMVISAIIILLCGVIAWGFVGKIDTTMPAVIVADDENAVIYVC